MEPQQQEEEEVPRKSNTQPWCPERRKGEHLQEEASPFSQEMLASGGQRCQKEGEKQDRWSAEAKLQLPKGCRRESSSSEEGRSKEEESQRPTENGSGRGKEAGIASPGEEVSRPKRSVKEDRQSDGERRNYEESLMRELSEKVQKVVKNSSWWERHGIDDTILALNFLILPVGFLLLHSDNLSAFVLGIAILGVAHHTFSVKGSHLASHNALVESKSWGKLWAIFFIEVCSAFTAEQGIYNHVKIHHGYTNVIGLGDSSTWKLPFLNRYVYMFLAPLAVPIITPLVAIGLLKEVQLKTAIRTVCCIFIGLYSHYWLLLNISGFQSVWSALSCMLVTRSLLAHPYIHVNIFQHIGLPMFSAERKPKRIHMMSCGVLNLPRNPLLDWSFGHSIISCHVEHHLFPTLSDNMCLKIKPIVSQYLTEKKLPYNEDSYWSRLKLFLDKYEELMIHAPPISELVGIQ
ncbi:fatty acid desaturase 6 [Pogona vitticeps]